MIDYSHIPSENSGITIKTEDVITTSTYEELSVEFQRLYPTVSRAIQLIELMYNRLTRVDKLSHKSAIAKIYGDHQHLPGFSQRNIRRSLMSLDNPPYTTQRQQEN
jgi:hypothetical protein